LARTNQSGQPQARPSQNSQPILIDPPLAFQPGQITTAPAPSIFPQRVFSSAPVVIAAPTPATVVYSAPPVITRPPQIANYTYAPTYATNYGPYTSDPLASIPAFAPPQYTGAYSYGSRPVYSGLPYVPTYSAPTYTAPTLAPPPILPLGSPVVVPATSAPYSEVYVNGVWYKPWEVPGYSGINAPNPYAYAYAGGLSSPAGYYGDSPYNLFASNLGSRYSFGRYTTPWGTFAVGDRYAPSPYKGNSPFFQDWFATDNAPVEAYDVQSQAIPRFSPATPRYGYSQSLFPPTYAPVYAPPPLMPPAYVPPVYPQIYPSIAPSYPSTTPLLPQFSSPPLFAMAPPVSSPIGALTNVLAANLRFDSPVTARISPMMLFNLPPAPLGPQALPSSSVQFASGSYGPVTASFQTPEGPITISFPSVNQASISSSQANASQSFAPYGAPFAPTTSSMGLPPSYPQVQPYGQPPSGYPQPASYPQTNTYPQTYGLPPIGGYDSSASASGAVPDDAGLAYVPPTSFSSLPSGISSAAPAQIVYSPSYTLPAPAIALAAPEDSSAAPVLASAMDVANAPAATEASVAAVPAVSSDQAAPVQLASTMPLTGMPPVTGGFPFQTLAAILAIFSGLGLWLWSLMGRFK
jgi:hypothetical protein